MKHRTTASRAAFCAGAAIAASGAFAQTSVTLYGVADGGFRVDHTLVGTLKSVSSGGAAGTRWGLRGVEDLGDGLKANFVFEQGFDLSDSSVNQGNVTGVTPTTNVSSTGGRIFGRISTVGLASDKFGAVRFGRDYKPVFYLMATVDPFGAGYVGSAGNVSPRLTSRYDNAVFYDSPALYGLRLSTGFGFGEATTDTRPGTPKTAGDRGGASLTYSAGNLYAAYAYSMDRAGATSPFLVDGLNRTRTNNVGITYDFEVVKLHAYAWKAKDDLGFDVLDFFAGVTVPFGVWTFLGGYAHINDRGASNPAAPTVKTNYDANFYAAAVNYSFSKRTMLYAAGAAFKIKNGGTYVFADANAPGTGLFTPANSTGLKSPWSAQVGVMHRF